MTSPVNRRSPGLAVVLLISVVAIPGVALSQQVGDPGFSPTLNAPAFPSGDGPRVAVDEGHSNFHTQSARFRPFADLLRSDGLEVDGIGTAFTPESLSGVRLLVIANALHERNAVDGNWRLPTPSAFSPEEIDVVRSWVERGGALLLIADHMPFPGAAADLAAAFGFELNNGFAMDTTAAGPLVFRRADGSLESHPVTAGRGADGRIDSVATFTGEAFRVPSGAVSLLVMPAGFISLMPDAAWEFGPDTPSVDVSGWSQGAVLEVGLGRVAVFGEAAMFTAQLAGPQSVPFGMNHPMASQNAQFVANLVRWLVRAR